MAERRDADVRSPARKHPGACSATPPANSGLDRRVVLSGGAAIFLAEAGRGAKPVPPATSRIHWPGPDGRTIHGYMAIPGKARGRQSASLVLGGSDELPPAPDTAARRLVDELAAAGFLACTADHVTDLADLKASLGWLRSNRLATGRVALVAIGGAAALADRLIAADPGGVRALLMIGGGGKVDVPALPPSLTVDWQPDDPVIPRVAANFLKEHLG